MAFACKSAQWQHQSKIILLLMGLLTSCLYLGAQSTKKVQEQFAQYRENEIKDRRFKHADIVPLISSLPKDIFSTEILGHSVEGREIYAVKVGTGPTKVLLWSQMHGNEPTATMAMFDLFNFFMASDSFERIRQDILHECTLYFIPMLNPDGAEKFARRNALDIDLNRDALRLTSPEAKILKKIRDEIEADWGFNLHDQNRYNSAGLAGLTASISFLAPAFNEAKEWNDNRTDAMQLVVAMNNYLQTIIPGQVGRYDDTFEPRAFGDNMQKWGTRTILIETGGLIDDREKQFLRELNFAILLEGLRGIASRSHTEFSLDEYEMIPFNRGRHHDLIIRNASLKRGDATYLIDLGIRKNEVSSEDFRNFTLRAYIADLGDLHNYFAYEEFDATGMTIAPGLVYTEQILSHEMLDELNPDTLIAEGYLYLQIGDQLAESEITYPLVLLTDRNRIDEGVKLGKQPNFLLQKNEQNLYAIINGEIFSLNK